jgi:F0F1-type ATP synthase assembly protein I
MVSVKSNKEPSSVVREAAPYLGLGIQLATAVILFYFIGKWADEKFDTSPWLMLLGVMVGTAGGFIKFFKTVIELSKKESTKKPAE